MCHDKSENPLTLELVDLNIDSDSTKVRRRDSDEIYVNQLQVESTGDRKTINKKPTKTCVFAKEVADGRLSKNKTFTQCLFNASLEIAANAGIKTSIGSFFLGCLLCPQRFRKVTITWTIPL